jgi:hypothetical protein
MPVPSREAVIMQLDRIDTALEAPEADKPAILRDALAWLAANSPADADALYFRERLEVIGRRHGSA